MEDDTKLGDIKKWIRERWENGCLCPSCGQHVQLRERTITKAMIRALIHISKTIGPVEISTVKEIRGGDYAKLRYWGLLENKSSGVWEVTLLGRKFLEDRARIPKSVFVYNTEVRGESNEDTSIREALGEKYDHESIAGKS